MTTKRTKSEIVDIVNAYITDLTPMIQIAERYGMTRQGIYKLLRRHGADTGNNGPMPVSCSACGTELARPRCRVRRQKNHFCNYDYYCAYLEASQHGVYKQNRTGQRIARSVVSECFELKPDHIVHHKDRNNLNNYITNLMVFANQGDHIRWHRLGPDYVTPLFDGSNVSHNKT